MGSGSEEVGGRKVPHARLFTRQDCSLCDRALTILARLAGEDLLTFDCIDIIENAKLTQRYALRIPVVELSTGARFEGRVSEYRLRQELTKDERRSTHHV
ncbi:MAG: glutaredoxin family protein [Ardenticatenaceae bacterium]